MSPEHLDIHGLVSPRLRGRLHAAAFVLAVPAAITLVGAADGTRAKLASAVYGVTLVMLFGASSAYHRLHRGLASRLWLRRVDHTAIYLLIAGTYTPVAVVAIGGTVGWVIVAAVWLAAAVGALLKLVWFDRTRVAGWVLYLSLGWLAVGAAPALVDHLTDGELALIVSGGLAYTAGAIVLAVRRPNPNPLVFGYHEVWHALVIVAAACHFAAIAGIVTAG